jgi:hypothetical protein
MKYALLVLSFAVGLWIGGAMADFDHTLAFLRHRSIVTHGVLIPLLAYALLPKDQDWIRLALIGVFVGMGAHLAYDLFPNGWGTYARINVPAFGYLDITPSVIWIALNVVGSLYIALLLVKHGYEVGLAAVGLAVTFLGYAPKENAFWWPLAALAAALALALVLPGSTVDAARLIQRRLKT